MSLVCRRLAVVSLVACLATGCTFTYRLRPELMPAPSASALIAPWPLAVGVYIPPSIRDRVLAQQLWRVPVGDATASTFEWAVANMFTKVDELDTPPAGRTAPSGLAGSIVLEDVALEGTPRDSLRYEIALYSAEGVRIDRWSLATPTALWDTRTSSFSLRGTVATDFSYAIRNLTAQFMVDFTSHAAVRDWLAAAGIDPPALRPDFKPARTAAPPANRVLLVPNIDTWLYSDAAPAMACVGERLARLTPPFEVIPADRVRLEFFPWLEPGTAPKSAKDVRNWLADPAIEAKMHSIGVRYLLEFRGGTTTAIPEGAMLCSLGCYGFIWGSHESAFSAYVMDIQGDSELGSASVTRRSGVYIPAFVFPVPLLAPTQASACEEMAGRLHEIFAKGAP
jgi:hypothetical protein